MDFKKQFKEGLLYKNPVLVQLLGMCSTLAITTSLFNGIGMGISVLVILTCCNVVVSLIRKVIPNDIRLALFVLVIAGFVTIVDLLLQAYIPAVPGKEPRKPEPGKEGLLGVGGVDDALILQGLHTALAAAPLQAQQQNTDPITYTDLYEWGLSGSANASERRRTFLRILGLPPRLSKKEIIQVLNTLYTRAALQAQLEAMK